VADIDVTAPAAALAGYRALAAAARDDTSDGLTARERLADAVDALLGMLGEPRTEWGAAYSTDQGSGVLPRDDEQDAREFIASIPQNARHYWRVVHRDVYRHEGPWVEVSGDE
jgi:hypothetical protein